jgi:hypothetical protein
MNGRRPAGRLLGIILGVWASAAFLVLWAGAVLNLAAGGHVAGDAWSWLGELPDLAQFAAWILLLPVAVALWVSQSDVPELVRTVAALGLVLWTAVAWIGLARALRDKRSG